MTPQLFIFGLNIIVISLFLALYGLMSGVNSLIGVASSLGVLGGVFIVYSRIPRDPTITALVNYSKYFLNQLRVLLKTLIYWIQIYVLLEKEMNCWLSTLKYLVLFK